MKSRVIPIVDRRNKLADRAADPSADNAGPQPIIMLDGTLADLRGRSLRDLRISVTDRCNFRCVYCMPRSVFDKDYTFLPHSALLSFEEITRVARAFIAQGVEKIRLTGGEPLLRKNIEHLIAMLAALRLPDGRDPEITLTTNASLLARKARGLKDAGLTRLTVSLDALDEAIFRHMNDADFSVAEVLAGIDAAQAAGLGPVKINMVVKRGMNDQEVVPMARHFRGSGHIVRFIEYMDVGTSNGWKLDEVVPSAEVLARIGAENPLTPIDANYPGEVAQRWRYADGSGEIGVISSVTRAFCGTCTRARLSTEGQLYTCLFASAGHDLRGLLRSGASEPELAAAIGQIWRQRDDRYSELRSSNTADLARIEMSYIGG